MYSSRGTDAYGRQQPNSQSYSGQSAFGQNLGPDGASHLSSRHSALLGSHSSAGAHYGGQYTSVYGSTTHDSVLQAPVTGAKGAGSSVLEGRSGYGLPMQERGSAYSRRDLQNGSTDRFADSIAFGHQHQADIYDRLDAATALRQELLQTRSLHSVSVNGSSRQAEYLAARAATVRHAGQEILPYGGRIDADLHTLSMISGKQHTPSILGAASRREVEDLVYARTPASPSYGVSLPPSRDYVTGKSLHGISLESAYPSGVLARSGYSRLDDRKDDVAYAREIERREEDRRREILREREREQERERERERDRERGREREREREREHRRERERILEKREKEREREIRRDQSLPRISRERARSTSAKRGRSLRRESPRRHSPVKEKRREYVCKVYSSNLVGAQRDYLSMDKRYSRLFVYPECSKVIVNWSKEDLNIPFNTPISFEHDFMQEETSSEHESVSTKTITDGHVKLETGTQSGSTRWNAKMLLMSGLSRNAWEELSSERKYEDRIPHLCNMLRFAFLKDGNSFMAIGGSWEACDGNDPSVDKSALIQTILRYAKELTGLDLKNCQNWNPFLEIHYDRIGKDGLFSHKEITVLYVPDLSNCLPSIDAWRDQWLAHKKSIAERERLHVLKEEKSREKKEAPKDKEPKTKTDLKKVEKQEKEKEAGSASKVNGKGKVSTPVKAENAGKEEKTVIKENVGDKTVTDGEDGDTTKPEKKDEVEAVDKGNNSEKKKQTDNASDVQTPGSAKKKIIRKVVKKKVVLEKDAAENVPKQDDTNKEAISEGADSSGTPLKAKTSAKNKATKKSPVVKAVKKEDDVKEPECSDDKTKNTDLVVKSTAKKKVIKKVTKKNAAAKDETSKDKLVKVNEAGSTSSEVKPENNEAVPQDVGGLTEVGNKSEKTKGKEDKDEKLKGGSDKDEKLKGGSDKDEKLKGGSDKDEKLKGGSDKDEKLKGGSDKDKKLKGGSDKNVKSKGGKEKKDKDVKTETRGKEVKGKKKVEEPPRHPGFILQTKGHKKSKLRSLSLSLDSLLDYADKDTKESTFELSLFAETFYEMLQYQMGSRILTFLQKLRIKFVAKRNQKKRQREEVSDKKEKEKKSSPKRQKTDDVTGDTKPLETETLNDEKDMVIDNVENTKKDESEKDEGSEESEEDPEEDPEEPEEDPEEDEHMADASPKNGAEDEEKAVVDKVDMDVKSEEKGKSEQEDTVKVTVNLEKKENSKSDTKKKESPSTIDKELLQAFRFFDRNRVGYIRVEDLRLILHALGKCMSHRDVKELVQSALLESNTGRDDQILYKKLVKMTDI